MQHDKTIAVLNELIETCKDGELSFNDAADSLTNPATKSKFLEYSRQRGEMARELQAQVRSLGGDPDQSGSMSGSLHRRWFDVKSAVTGKNDHSIASEAERGEDVAKGAYDNALTQDLPPAIRAIVQQHAAKVKQVHDEVKAIRDREKHAQA